MVLLAAGMGERAQGSSYAQFITVLLIFVVVQNGLQVIRSSRAQT